MKPKPFELLNHLTVPCTVFVLPELKRMAQMFPGESAWQVVLQFVHGWNGRSVSERNPESIELRQLCQDFVRLACKNSLKLSLFRIFTFAGKKREIKQQPGNRFAIAQLS